MSAKRITPGEKLEPEIAQEVRGRIVLAGYPSVSRFCAAEDIDKYELSRMMNGHKPVGKRYAESLNSVLSNGND